MEDSQTTISEGEWSSLGKMYTSGEADLLAELLGSYFTSNVDVDAMGFALSCLQPTTTTVASADDGGSFYNSNFCCFQSPGHGDCNLSYSNHQVVTNVSGSSSVNVWSDVNSLPEEGAELKGGTDMSKKERDDGGGDKNGDKSVGKSKKRIRIAGNATTTKRNVKSKKKQNFGLPSTRDEDDINASDHRPDLSARNPDDDSFASKHQHTGSTSISKDVPTALDVTNGKTRASRGSATDPQSLYARKRRERINERLRILQNLIPNGTKVDISTMLEEAVQYVKFLQLQIKLLSSDDLWMYAPIAYNGMDIGLDAAALVRATTSKLPPGLPRFEI